MDRPTILIVDDEPEFLISFSILLGEEFNVLTASDGREGLELINNPEKRLSLIILDLKMPGISGIEVVKCIRNADCKIPIIILTGNCDCLMKCLEQDAHVIQKPIAVDMLVDRIRNILGLC